MKDKFWLKMVVEVVFLAAIIYAIGATVIVSVMHPEYTETQKLIKLVYWGYEPE